MGVDFPVHAAVVQTRSPPSNRFARGLGRDPVYRRNRRPVGAATEGISSVHNMKYYLYQLRDRGVLDVINETLVTAARIASGRNADLTAGVIDSQSVKTTEGGGLCSYGAGKKIKRHKRHIATDTQGHLLAGLVHVANIQDRDGAVSVIEDMRASFPKVACLFADGGYAGDKLELEMLKVDGPKIKIVKRPEGDKGFVVIARRWVIEHTFAWLGRCRRLAKDWEKTIASSEAWMIIASIR